MFNLREIREKKNMTLLEVANASDVSEAYVSYLETGRRRPSVEVAKRIAEVLGFDWTLFFK